MAKNLATAAPFLGFSPLVLLGSSFIRLGRVHPDSPQSFRGGFFGLKYSSPAIINITDSFCAKPTNSNDLLPDFWGFGKSLSDLKQEMTFKAAEWDLNAIWDIDSTINDDLPYLINNQPE